MRYCWYWRGIRCLNGGGGRNPTFVIRQRPLIWVILNPKAWLRGIHEVRLPWKVYGRPNHFCWFSGTLSSLWDWIKKKDMIKNNHRFKTSWSPTIPSSEGDEILSTCFPAKRNFPSTPERRGKMSNWKPPISAFPVTCSSTVYPEPRSAATNFYIVQTTPLIWRTLLTCRITPGPETIPSNHSCCPATT